LSADGHIRPSAQPLDHLDSAEAWQPEVEDDEFGFDLCGDIQSLGPGPREVHVIPAGREIDTKGFEDLGIVIDDENAHQPASRRIAVSG
jgi:hypothetical protein